MNRDVVLVGAGAATPSVIYQVPDPATLDVQDVATDGRYVLISIKSAPRPPPGTVPGSSPMPNVQHLVVLDLRTNADAEIAGMAAHGGYIDNAVMIGSTVYWDERASYGSGDGVVRAYQPATGRTRTVYRGPVGELLGQGAGVAVETRRGLQLIVGTPLPAVVAAATDASERTTIAGDGTAWAWYRPGGVIGWWAPGQRTPSYVRVRGSGFAGAQPGDPVGPPTVAGRFVLAGETLVDIRTGSAAPLPRGGPYGGHTVDFPILPGRAGVLLGFAFTGSAGFSRGVYHDRPTQPLVLDTRQLPGLHC